MAAAISDTTLGYVLELPFMGDTAPASCVTQ
jgi:hypothetical protein